jgi:hypothetical protein
MTCMRNAAGDHRALPTSALSPPSIVMGSILALNQAWRKRKLPSSRSCTPSTHGTRRMVSLVEAWHQHTDMHALHLRVHEVDQGADEQAVAEQGEQQVGVAGHGGGPAEEMPEVPGVCHDDGQEVMVMMMMMMMMMMRRRRRRRGRGLRMRTHSQ